MISEVDLKKLFGTQLREMGSRFNNLTYLEIDDDNYTQAKSISIWKLTELLHTHVHSVKDQHTSSLPILRKKTNQYNLKASNV